jgi:hypothetical protein
MVQCHSLRVGLHRDTMRPLEGSMLRSNMRGHPGLTMRCTKGSPEALRELRNSVG